MLLKPDDKDIERTISRGIILTITLVAAALLILNVVLISFYVKRRARKQMMSGAVNGSSITNGKLSFTTIFSNLCFFLFLFMLICVVCCVSANFITCIRHYATCWNIKTCNFK